MNHQPANRPRMAATYAPGTVRARRWHGDGDEAIVRLAVGRHAPT